VQSVLENTRLSMAVTIALAFFTIPIAVIALNATFAIIWLVCTLALNALVYFRAQSKMDLVITRVSGRLWFRLLFFQFVLALPFAVLLIAIMGFGSREVANFIAWSAAGMAAGGAAMLRRTPGAALIYFGTLIASALFGLWLKNPEGAPYIAACICMFGIFLFYLSAFMGETERERDRTLAKLSAAIETVKAARDENHRLANVDPVTGLANRKAVSETLTRATDSFQRDGRTLALILLDLDRFKNINDTFGHPFGDQLLTLIGQRLTEIVGDKGKVGRLGGDEFAVLLSDVDDATLRDICEAISASIQEPAHIDGRVVFPGTSLGIAQCPKDGETPDALMLAADIALNAVKARGRGAILRFDDTLSAGLIRMDAVEAALRAALEAQTIAVHYQPKVELKTGALAGAKALVRWRDPDLGHISPGELFHVASERGLIPDLSGQLATTIAGDIAAWRHANVDTGTISINVHPVELKSPDLLRRNIAIFAEHGVTASDIIIEVTEGCFVGRGNDEATFILDGLAEEGYALSLDDFGTGHAALSHLRHLPVQELKIDKTFIIGLVENASDHAIVAATTEIARGMGIRAVAEGVETKEQVDALVRMNVDIAQGYYWAAPLAAPDFVTYVRSISNGIASAAG